jgi:hypothetical protein
VGNPKTPAFLPQDSLEFARKLSGTETLEDDFSLIQASFA